MKFNIMKFNLKKYITEKYLTESVLSNILINKILNDKSGLFKYYKIDSSSSYKKFEKIYNDLKTLTLDIFAYQKPSYKNKQDDNTFLIENNGIYITDNKFKLLHKKYLELYQQYVKEINNLFVKPEPLLLTYLCEYNIDIFNITDDNFKIFYYKDLKGNKLLQANLYNELSKNLAFFITENNKIEAISLCNKIKMLGLDSPYYKEQFYTYNTSEQIKEHINKNISQYTILVKLKESDEILEFPIVTDNLDFISNYHLAYYIIKTKLNVNSYKSEVYKLNDLSLKIGKIISKASTLLKITNWGSSLNDYIIIYTPSTYFDNSQKSYSHLGYNEFKNSNEMPTIRQRKKDYKSILSQTYKWVKDILGKYKPYAGGKQNTIWEYGKNILEQDYKNLYDDDSYNNQIVRDNIERYKVLVQQQRSIKNIKIYENDLKTLLVNINNAINISNKLSNEIKNTYKEDKTKFKTLMFLFGTFNKTISIITSYYSKIQKKLIQYNTEDNKKRTWETKDDFYQRLKYEIDSIKSQIALLKNYIEQIDDINDKINNILNNNE